MANVMDHENALTRAKIKRLEDTLAGVGRYADLCEAENEKYRRALEAIDNIDTQGPPPMGYEDFYRMVTDIVREALA